MRQVPHLLSDAEITAALHSCRAQLVRYYAITIARLMELMRDAGFVNVTRDDATFFQPILIGFRSD